MNQVTKAKMSRKSQKANSTEKQNPPLDRASTSKGQTSSDTVSRWSHITQDSDISDYDQSKYSMKLLKKKLKAEKQEEEQQNLPQPSERELFEQQRGPITQDSDSSLTDEPKLSYDFLEGKKYRTSLPDSLTLSDTDEVSVQAQITINKKADLQKPPI